ncbi:MAG: hypothetical protein QM757_47260 [Paludibaculum sp.]
MAVSAAEFDGKAGPRRGRCISCHTARGQLEAGSYLWVPFEIPDKIPEGVNLKKLELRMGGGFYIGQGKYSVEWSYGGWQGPPLQGFVETERGLQGCFAYCAPEHRPGIGQRLRPGFASPAPGT